MDDIIEVVIRRDHLNPKKWNLYLFRDGKGYEMLAIGADTPEQAMSWYQRSIAWIDGGRMKQLEV